MSWLTDNAFNIITLLFGTGGIGYAVVTKVMDRKKDKQNIREASAVADIKTDEFWKGRYDVLNNELSAKENFWKCRYESLYNELQDERKLSNDLVKSFRTELNEIRNDYEKQREIDKRKYDELLNQYRLYEEESKKQESEQLKRISQLEQIIAEYEKRLNKNEK